MIAVFTFEKNKNNTWLNEKYERFTFSLAVHFAKKHFRKVHIITDSYSLPLLQKLKLPIDQIIPALDGTKQYDKRFWAISKIKSYSIQKEPFVHIDNDFILFKPLSIELLNSEIAVQSKDCFSNYENKVYCNLIQRLKDSNVLLPDYYNVDYAYNQGIYLVNNLEFNKEYCKEIFKIIDSSYNTLIRIKTLAEMPIIWEQYTLASFANKKNIKIACIDEVYNTNNFEKNGYLHLMHNKKDHRYFHRIKELCKEHCPTQFKIIETDLSLSL